MTGAARRTFSADLDTLRLAVWFSILTGAIALVLPFLNALTAALAAIAVAAALESRSRSNRPTSDVPTALRWIAGSSVAGGALAFLALPPPWSGARGLVLGGSFLPWVWANRRPVRRSRGGPLAT